MPATNVRLFSVIIMSHPMLMPHHVCTPAYVASCLAYHHLKYVSYDITTSWLLELFASVHGIISPCVQFKQDFISLQHKFQEDFSPNNVKRIELRTSWHKELHTYSYIKSFSVAGWVNRVTDFFHDLVLLYFNEAAADLWCILFAGLIALDEYHVVFVVKNDYDSTGQEFMLFIHA